MPRCLMLDAYLSGLLANGPQTPWAMNHQALWHDGIVALWHYGYVPLWLRGSVARLLCGDFEFCAHPPVVDAC